MWKFFGASSAATSTSRFQLSWGLRFFISFFRIYFSCILGLTGWLLNLYLLMHWAGIIHFKFNDEETAYTYSMSYVSLFIYSTVQGLFTLI